MASRNSFCFACTLVTALLAVSCQFAGRRQTVSIEGKEVADSGIVTLELSEQKAISAAEPEEVVEVLEEEQQKHIDAWYDHDFSLVVVMHKYVNISTPFPQADETVLVTRISDKAYIQSSVQEVVRKCTTLEPIPEGYRETIFKNGKVDWTHDFDNGTLNYQVGYRLRHDYILAKDIPTAVDLANAQETTRCGRPAWEVEVEEVEDGAKALSTFVIDQEYRFFYSVKQVGKNKYGHDVNITLFDVTSFTDKPTAKDIPDPKNTVSQIEKMKRQLQNQLDVVGK